MNAYNVKVHVTGPDNLPFTVNAKVEAESVNHAKGAGQYKTQLDYPGCQTAVVDCYRIVSLKNITPVE